MGRFVVAHAHTTKRKIVVSRQFHELLRTYNRLFKAILARTNVEKRLANC